MPVIYVFKIDRCAEKEGGVICNMTLFTFPVNCSDSAYIPLSTAKQPLASVAVNINGRKTVMLFASIGWKAIKSNVETQRTTILFSIWRGVPYSGTIVCSAKDSGEAHADQFKATTFFHIDELNELNEKSKTETYILAAELAERNSFAAIIGGLTFSAAFLD